MSILLSIFASVGESVVKSAFPLISTGTKVACDAAFGADNMIRVAEMIIPEEEIYIPLDVFMRSQRVVRPEVRDPIAFSYKKETFVVTSVLQLYKEMRATLIVEYGDENFWLSVRGKPLNLVKKLGDYGFDESIHPLTVHFGCMGGSQEVELPSPMEVPLPANEAVALETRVMHARREPLWNVQGDAEEASEHSTRIMWAHVLKRMNEYAKSHSDRSDEDIRNDKQWVMCMVENVFQSYYWFKRTDNYLMWAQLVYKLFTGRSSTQAVIDKWNQIFGKSEVQGNFGDTLKMLRRAFDTAQNLGEHPVLKKFHTLYTYLLVQGFLSRLGLELNEDEYSKLEMHTMKATHGAKRGLWVAALDVLLFLSEKFYEFYETKDISVFCHTSSEYSEWLKESDRLMALAGFTGNLEAHGTTYFAFLSDLDKAIEKGDAYVKYSLTKAGYDSAFVRKRLGALKLTKATTVTIDASSRSRKAPFGVLVYGKSGLGKTSVEHMMYYYYASLRGLDNSEASRYTRNPLVDFWTNFRTSCWCILLDDMAFMKPGVTGDIDPSIKDLILICNMVGYSPAQAALEDKGKTPVMCELVIASGNTIDLNASEYFADPLAVQRRLPFIVTVEVKDQYKKQDSDQLDSEKLDMNPAHYPDYWRFTVSKIVPTMEGRTERAKIEAVSVYEHSADFLEDFGKSALKHIKSQEDFMACNDYMSKLEVCKGCLRPKYACKCLDVQAEVIVQPTWVKRSRFAWVTRPFKWCFWTMYSWYVAWFMWCLKWRLSIWMLHFVLRVRFTRKVIYKVMLSSLPEKCKFNVLGLLNSIKTVPKRWAHLSSTMKAVLSIGAVAMAGYAALGVMETVKQDTDSSDKQEKIDKVETKIEEPMQTMALQGNAAGTLETQLRKEEMQNVWYNPVMETATCDVPVASRSMIGLTDDELIKTFGNNVVRLIVTYTREDGAIVHHSLAGVYIMGQIVMTEPHLFGTGKEFQVNLIQSAVADGVTSNITFLLKRDEIVFNHKKELCVFRTIHNQPKRDLRKYWLNKDDMRITQFARICREKSGRCVVSHVKGVYRLPHFPVHVSGVDATLDMLRGVCDIESKDGDCGTMMVATVPRGSIICGMHLLGSSQDVCGMIITLDDVEELIAQLDSKDEMPLHVQSGEMPALVCSKNTFALGPIHHRSKVRYLHEGTLKVYGSLPHYGTRMKSNVCATPLQSEMCEHFNRKVEFCAPVLSGYEPWRNNLVNMVTPCFNVEKEIVEECAEAYYQDIKRELPSDWSRELIFLSRKAAVNGLPGVRYVDGINRATSMGFPFNTSKKAYLVPDVDENYPEGVTFTPEVWKEFERIEQCYARGERANPVFAANLKDSAVTFKKAAIKKTRVFTGSPNAWSLFVRSRLLTFVRLVQKNKFAFEAAPGVVTMSSEWGRIRDYLTEFGEHRMIAGDYRSYDKDMIAFFILEAFKVIARFYRDAGFTMEECREIMCIGYDTAFSWCNFDGDLLEFFGTNPSGHPLTVIINSIVNSLYMRYAYRKMNPKQEVKTFKQNVHLMTYGDDNVAGVHEGVDWFNHTAIVAALKTIGLTYTMADKEAESVPYIHIDQVSFLKRTWRWDEDMQVFLCPLSEESIHRSLTVWTASKTIDPDTQMCEVITSAHDEFFFYGRERFEKEHKYFMSILERPRFAIIPNIKLCSWNQLADRYRRCSEYINKEYATYDAAHGVGKSCV